MKTLLLLRHGKSSWDDSALSDFDRPLKKRGIKDAARIGRFMWERKVRPDLVLSSSAKRAAQTAELVRKSAHLDCELRYEKRLYAATAAAMRDVLSKEGANVVLLVGHNPGLQELLQYLTGELEEMPTAALAQIVLEVESWSELREKSGRLDWLALPKSLGK